MKSNICLGRFSISSFMILGWLALSTLAPASWAGGCVEFTESLQTTFFGPNGPFVGPSILTIDGVGYQANFTTVLTKSTHLKEDGGIRADFADFWGFPDGSALTAIAAVETFPDPNNPLAGTFTADTRFTGGTDNYTQVHGKGTLTGTFSFDPSTGVGTTVSSTTGKLCGFGNN